MLHPSYSELIDILNEDADMDQQINSRYTIVIAASKRARQLVDGAQKLTAYSETDKAVSIAVNEMYERALKIKMATGDEPLDDELPSEGSLFEDTLSGEPVEMEEIEFYDENEKA